MSNYTSPGGMDYTNYNNAGYPQMVQQPLVPQVVPDPIVTVQPVAPPTVIVNQVVPGISAYANTSSPYPTICPYCQKQVTTNPLTSCNFVACLACYFGGFLLYCIVQLARGKDICCCNADHRCPICQRTIAIYNPC